MNIEFTPDEWYEHHRRKLVWFRAVVDEKVVECGISIDALTEHCEAYADDPPPAFRNHRQQIWDSAAKLITARRFADDRTIMIQSAALEPAKRGAPAT